MRLRPRNDMISVRHHWPLAGSLVRSAAIGLGLSLTLLGTSRAAETVTGPATVTGSDTLTVNGTALQLNGLDAVELQQSCFVDGQAWACGAAATRALQTLIEGVTVTCTPTGETNGDAQFAVCMSEGQDVGENLVQNGWAVANPAQSDAYVALEKQARDGAVGIWRGSFLPPADFRQNIAAIEKSYLALAHASILADAEKTLESATGVDFFTGAKLATVGPEDSRQTLDQKVNIHNLSPGFIPDALSTHDIFSWPAVSEVLETWRRSAVTTLLRGTRSPIWDGLLSHQHRVTDVKNENDYYEAMRRYSAPWIEQGRQPVLLTPQSVPGWVTRWLGGDPPEGSKVQKKAGITQQGYLGTIDGIDIYAGAPMPTDISVLSPSDLLASATYRKNAQGSILELDQTSQTTPDLVFRYSIALEWKPDEIIWLHYPYEDHQ
jgi:endonuclease YncB( thermonuclease family)